MCLSLGPCLHGCCKVNAPETPVHQERKEIKLSLVPTVDTLPKSKRGQLAQKEIN